MSIELGYIEEQDLLCVNSNFFFKTVSPLDENWNNKSYSTVEKNSTVIVIENNFGSTYKERYLALLYRNKLIYASFYVKCGYTIDDDTFTKVTWWLKKLK